MNKFCQIAQSSIVHHVVSSIHKNVAYGKYKYKVEFDVLDWHDVAKNGVACNFDKMIAQIY